MKVVKLVNLLAGLVLVILLLVAGINLQQLLNQQPAQDKKPILLTTAADCDLNQQGCTARLAKRSVVLSFSEPVSYLTKFKMQVTTSGFGAGEIETMIADFTMPDMQMGINRFALHRAKQQDIWQGLAILPACVTGRIDWRVTLYLVTKEANYTAVYDLLVKH